MTVSVGPGWPRRPTPSPTVGKAGWRRWARALPPVAPDVSDAVAGHVRSFLATITGEVCGYVALADEVDISPALESPPVGIRWVLPRIDETGALGLHRDDGRRRRNSFGLVEPHPDCETVEAASLAAVLVPGRVFDRRGYRLGRGGGHYDRLLTRVAEGIPVIGVATADRIVDAVPTEAHDLPMTHLVTEHGLTPTPFAGPSTRATRRSGRS